MHFQPLRAATKTLNILIAAHRTRARHTGLRAAVMTAQQAVSQMQHAIGRALRALAHPAAGGASQHRRIATAIQEHQRLLAARQSGLDGGEQLRAQTVVELDQPGVDDAGVRHVGGGRAVGQAHQLITPALRVMPGFERRRGRAQHHRHAAIMRPPHRQIARGIPHAILLFETLVVLFIDHDQRQARHGREDGQPRAQHDVGAAAHRLQKPA